MSNDLFLCFLLLFRNNYLQQYRENLHPIPIELFLEIQFLLLYLSVSQKKESKMRYETRPKAMARRYGHKRYGTDAFKRKQH